MFSNFLPNIVPLMRKWGKTWYSQAGKKWQYNTANALCVRARVCIYRVSQEECARLREGVPYVKLHRYNPKHLHPKLNGYGDNGQRKVGASCGSKYCNLHNWCHVTILTSLTVECSVHCACVTLCAVSHVTSPLGFLVYSACNPKDNYDMSESVFVVQFNGFMSLTS